MIATELQGFAQILSKHRLGTDRIWSRPLNQISDTEIQLFYARSDGQRQEAADLIGALQSELLLEAFRGTVDRDSLRIIAHEPPEPRYVVDDFIDQLAKLTRAQRQATLLALTTKTALPDIAAMEWGQIPSTSQIDGIAREILLERSKVRHLRLPYVFWEYVTDRIAAPLIKLDKEVERVFNKPWPTIQLMWNEVIWISPRSEHRGFLNLVEEVRSGKL